MKPCNITHQIIKTISGNTTCRIHINTIQALHDLRVVRNLKIRYNRITEPLYFNICTVVRTNRD